jgi:hypothetical protein
LQPYGNGLQESYFEHVYIHIGKKKLIFFYNTLNYKFVIIYTKEREREKEKEK